MLHFPSTLRSNSAGNLPRRTDSLNATQHKSGSSPILLKIEEELHDARRVKAHGQEEDLRLALDMVINRVTELSSLLTETYKGQADLEVQLNVAKSNLALVISNNEMLEEALRRDNSGSSREVGWRRRSGRDNDSTQERQSLEEWQQVADIANGGENQHGSAVGSPQIPSQGQENGRFFRFRFASSSTSSRPTSRPTTPGVSTTSPQIPQQATSPSLPSHVAKELEDLSAELQKERAARKVVEQEKTNLEAELESLSQALFEEANKMVATERIKLAETEEELNELRLEKEALKRALRLIEGENHSLRESGNAFTRSLSSLSDLQEQNPPIKINRSRSSSEVAIKSRPGSLILESAVPLPPSPAPEITPQQTLSTPPFTTSQSQESNDSQATPKKPQPQQLPFMPSAILTEFDHPSPWADVPTSPGSPPPTSVQARSGSLYAAAALTL